MSAILPSATLSTSEVLENEANQPDQPRANLVNTAIPARLHNGNGSHTEKTRYAESNPGPRKSDHGKQVSAEEYLRHYAEHPDFNYEWNNGILEEKPVSTIAQLRLYRWFLQILSYYLEVNHLAEAAMFEFLAEMAVGDKLVKRKPDLLIVRHDNPRPLHDEDDSYAGVCDLCVELLSTSNQANIDRDITKKKAEYEAAGVHEYLILDRDGDHMEFYRLDANGTYATVQPDAAGLVTFETLPGFQFRWADLFTRPPLRALVEDPVYTHYILPEYDMLKRRVEQAEQRAEQETLRAEWYAAHLRTLGIDPSTLPKFPQE
jgi:Uma2 family endonuclease